MKTLICFGDSITAEEAFADGTPRLTPRLREALPGVTVHNAGIPGENCGDGLARLRHAVLDHDPDLVQILFGANDAACGKQVPMEHYRANLQAMCEAIGPGHCLFLTPLPVVESRAATRTNAVLRSYADIVMEMAQACGAHRFDTHAAFLAFAQFADCFEADGVHLTGLGYKRLADLVVPILQALLNGA